MRKRWWRRVRLDDDSGEGIEHILIVLLMPIGDTLFATPTIHALRQRYPHARIDALVYPTNRGILEGNPDIDTVLLHPTGQTWPGWLAYLGFLMGLRRAGYDLVMECGPYQWWLSAIARTPRRLALDFPIPLWFIPTPHRPWVSRHAVDSYATLLRDAGVAVDTSSLVVCPSSQHRQAALRFLEEEAIIPTVPLLGIHPGGEGFHTLKRWGIDEFARVATALAHTYGATVLVFGGSDEAELAQAVASRIDGAALSLGGRVSLGVATALLERCFLFVGNDSAPMHMAAAVGTPTLGIFGPSDPYNYHPVGRHVAVVRSDLACSPCFHFVGSATVWGGSQCRDNQCLHLLAPNRVVMAAHALLARSGNAMPRQAPRAF